MSIARLLAPAAFALFGQPVWAQVQQDDYIPTDEKMLILVQTGQRICADTYSVADTAAPQTTQEMRVVYRENGKVEGIFYKDYADGVAAHNQDELRCSRRMTKYAGTKNFLSNFTRLFDGLTAEERAIRRAYSGVLFNDLAQERDLRLVLQPAGR